MTTTVNTINGNEGNNRLTGTSRNDVINGNGGNDRLNGGAGADILNGGAGKDELNGGSGNDVLDGGSGSDELEGGSGNDTLIYTLAENNVIGRMTYDEYEGGSGTDTLELRFTRAEWMNTNNQTVLQNYINWASKSGSGCRWDDDFIFRFSNAKLEIEDIEKLVVKVDNQIINNVGKKKNVDAVNDTPDSITEDTTDVLDIDVLDNDSVDNLVKNLELLSNPTNGTVELVKPSADDASTWYFKYTPNSTYYQSLNTSQSATETFTYRVTDADGDQDTAEVKITITGINDAAIITGAISGTVIENGSDTNRGSNNNGGSPTENGQLFSSIANNDSPFKPVENQSTNYGEFSITSQGLWTYKLNNANGAVNALNIGGSLPDSFTIYTADNTEQIITIDINGANDAAFIEDPRSNKLREDSINTENNTVAVFDKLNVVRDVDNILSFISGSTPSQTNFGNLIFLEDGRYIYEVQNSLIQFLRNDQELVESFIVKAVDGTPKTISFIVFGANDAAVIGDPNNNQVTEDAGNIVDGFITLTGEITVEDADNGEAFFQTDVIALSTNKGTLDLNSFGSYTYKVSNADIQSLNASDHPIDEFKIYSIDGTEKTIFITINGADDVVNSAPVVKELGEGENKYAGSANVEELINLKYDNPTISEYVARGGDFDYLHVRTGQFSFRDADLADMFTITSAAAGPQGNLGTLTFDDYTNAKDSSGNIINGEYIVKWTYTVKDSDLDPLNTPAAGSSSKDDDFIVTIGDGTTTIDTKIMLNLSGRNEIEFVEGENEGNNVIKGAIEDDFKYDNPGNDVIYFGDGFDRAYVDNGGDVIYGGNGGGVFDLLSDDSVVFGGDGIDYLSHSLISDNGLTFGGNGKDIINFYGDYLPKNSYSWGGGDTDTFYQFEKTTAQSNSWVMDFNFYSTEEGGDKIMFIEENFFSGQRIHVWTPAKTQLLSHTADTNHPFLSEGAGYYELKVQTSTNFIDPNWYSVLNLVGINGAEITLDSLFANGNLNPIQVI